jgi:hypothetical protein
MADILYECNRHEGMDTSDDYDFNSMNVELCSWGLA